MKRFPYGRAGILSGICARCLALAWAVCCLTGFAPLERSDELPSVDPGKLEVHKPVTGALGDGQSREYWLDLSAGDYARVIVTQRSVDVLVSCLDPSGRELFSSDSSVVGSPEAIDWIADTQGRYRLRLTTAERRAPDGAYEIEFVETAPASDRHEARIAAARRFADAMASRKDDTREGFLRAISQADEALRNWRASGDRSEIAASLLTIGLLYIEVADRPNALHYTTEGLAAAEAIGDPKLTGRALEAVGRVYNAFGDKRKAIDYCERALPLLRSAGDRAGEANALDNTGVAYAGTGDRRKALVYYRDALAIFEQLQDRRMIAELEGNIGVAYESLGEYRRSLDSHEKELAIARDLTDRGAEAVTLNNIANAYTGLGEYQKSLDAYSAALELNRALDNQWNVAVNLNNIAWVYGELGDRQHALNFYQQSLALIRKVKDERRMASTLNNIARIHADAGDFRKAAELHREALALRRSTGDLDGEANTLANLGNCYAKLGEPEKARAHLEQAVAIHRDFGNRYMLARSLRAAALFEREARNLERARSSLEEALEIARAIRDRRGEAEALGELAKVDRDRGNLDRAQELAGQALAAFDSLRLSVMSPSLRTSLVASVRDVHDFRIDLLMRLHARQPGKGFDAAALLASEHGRARSLIDMLRESGVDARGGVDPALLDRERELSRVISAKAELQTRLLNGKRPDAAAVEKELDALALELDQVQSRIREASPQYAALSSQGPLSLEAIQGGILDDNTILLEYALGAERSYLWAVSRSSVESFELPARAVIESAARSIYEVVTSRNRRLDGEAPADSLARVRQADAAFVDAARAASLMLLGPVGRRLGSKRLLIVSDGLLHYLPFAALPEPGTDTPLMVAHAIVSAPSASVLAVLRQETEHRKPAPKLLAVFADPVFQADDARLATVSKAALRSGNDLDMRSLPRLRFSRSEAQAITRLAGTSDAFVALDFDANREAAMKPEIGDYRVVHFATHSLLNNDRPELSGIVLSLVDSAGRPQNGFLRLYDIYNLRLNADLVVLSACRTALGEEVKGEGLIGLTRGFLYAGSPRVVATLWEIDDRTTAEAMKRFYQRMLADGEPPAEALRNMQLALWQAKGWDAPYYWAAFTLEGEWR